MSAVASRFAERLPRDLFVRLIALQYPLFEPELRHLRDFVPADKVAVDIGTWWGPWSWWLARRVPRVEGFEPNRSIFSDLQASSALPENVILHNVALSDRCGESVLWSPSHDLGTEGRSTLSRNGHRGWVQQTVATQTLDSFEFSDVGFVKIDVEGHELEVLRGACKLLETERPNVLVEVEHRGTAGHMDEVFGFFEKMGYSGHFFSRGGWLPLSELDQDATRARFETEELRGMLRSTMSRHQFIHNFLFLPQGVRLRDASTLGRTQDAEAGFVRAVRPTRHAAQRLLRRGKYLLGHDPITLPILLRLTPTGTSRQITDLTDVVVEGFPRSGNTFMTTALQNATNHRIRIASHVHHPSQVKLACSRGLPTVLVVRNPVDTLTSYLAYGQHGRPSRVIAEYCSYHRELLPYLDQLLVCDFEETTKNVSLTIARINERFGLDLPPFDDSLDNRERVFDEISRLHWLTHPKLTADFVAPRPSEARNDLALRLRAELQSPRYAASMADAQALYSYLVDKAAEQRMTFELLTGDRDGATPGS